MLTGVLVIQVRDNDLAGHAMLLSQLGSQCLQTILAPCHENEMMAHRRQLPGELCAQTRRGARDQRVALTIRAFCDHRL